MSYEASRRWITHSIKAVQVQERLSPGSICCSFAPSCFGREDSSSSSQTSCFTPFQLGSPWNRGLRAACFEEEEVKIGRSSLRKPCRERCLVHSVQASSLLFLCSRLTVNILENYSGTITIRVLPGLEEDCATETRRKCTPSLSLLPTLRAPLRCESQSCSPRVPPLLTSPRRRTSSRRPPPPLLPLSEHL